MTNVYIYVFVWYAFGITTLRAGEVNGGYNCVLRYVNWISPKSLSVNWTIDDGINNRDFVSEVTWFTNYNEGKCGTNTLTSCRWYYGKSSVNFFYPFSLNVTILNRKSDMVVYNKIFHIDPLVNCSKPPKIDIFAVTCTNSTCVNVRWKYENKSSCAEIDTKLYVIDYSAPVSFQPLKSAGHFNLTTTSCEGRLDVCSLHPSTIYTFSLRTKMVDFGSTGHFSDTFVQVVKTQESAPSGSPKLFDGCWSGVNNECTKNNKRSIRIFWQDVFSASKNGNITSFIMTIKDGAVETEYRFPGGHFSGVVDLKCDKDNNISIRAVNNAGVSPQSPAITIPQYNPEVGPVEHVIPEITENSFHVSWRPQVDKKGYIAVWCLKYAGRQCQSSINRVVLTKDAQFITIPRDPDILPHDYAIAIASTASGATWAECHFVDRDIPTPSAVTIATDASLKEGSMVVSWINRPCSESLPGPYIDNFHLIYCEVGSKDIPECLDSKKVIIIHGRRDMYVFENLNPGAMYKVQMKATGLRNKTSLFSKNVFGKARWKESIFSSGFIALSAVVGLVVLSCAVYGLCMCNRRMCQKWSKYKEVKGGIILPVIPEDITEM